MFAGIRPIYLLYRGALKGAAYNGRLVLEEPDIRTFAVKLIACGEKLALMRSNFLSPLLIAGFFQVPNAHVRVETAKSNAWIIVEKA